MRVAIVCPITFGPAGYLGGGTRYPEELARHLRPRLGCDLIAFGAEDDDFVDASGLRHFVLRDQRGVVRNADPFSTRLLRLLASYDVAHFHTVNKAALVGAALCRARGRVAVLTPLGGGGRAGLGRLGFHRAFSGFSIISEHTTVENPWISTRPHAVVYGGGDASALRGAAPGAAHRESARLAYVGRVMPHKGIDVIIRALPPEAELVVCGQVVDDAYAAHLADLARGRRVELVAEATDETVAHLYATSSAVVLPSLLVDYRGVRHPHPELLGLVLLEAMWHSTPVIASRAGAMPEIVAEGENGLLVEPGDVASMEKALRRILEDPAGARRMGAEGRRMVEERFTWAQVADRVIRFYAHLGARVPAPA